MQYPKEIEQSSISNNMKIIEATSKFKFSNLQKLNCIVNDLTKEQITTTTGSESGLESIQKIEDKVLNTLKSRIKSNYEKLYRNYDDNKTTILTKIHEIENNHTKETAAHLKINIDFKNKYKYDKIKTEINKNNNKLKQLIDLRDRIKRNIDQNSSLQQQLEQKIISKQQLEKILKNLQYENAILIEMRQNRNKIQLHLKQKYNKILKQELNKQDKIKKLEDNNHNKQIILLKIKQNLEKQQLCQIPLTLAQELEKRVDKFQNRLTYQTIFKHQNIKMEEKLEENEKINREQKILREKMKEQKDKIQQQELQLAYNMYLIKKGQEEKLKKISGATTLQEVQPGSLEKDHQNLNYIEEDMKQSINQIKNHNQALRDEIQQIITQQSDDNKQDQLHCLEQQLEVMKNQQRIILRQVDKKQIMLKQWQGIIQMMSTIDCNRETIGINLQQILRKLENNQNSSIDNQKISINQL